MANDQTIDGVIDGSGTEVAERDPQEVRLSAANAFIQRMKPHMADVLPKQITPERLARLLYGEVRKNPNLLQCTQESLLGAMLTSVQLGLEPGGAGGECWLLPFRNHGTMEASFMLGYKGMVKLYWNHPLAADLDTNTVYEGDEFSYRYGTGKRLDHEPTRPLERGELRCYFAQAHLKSGGAPFVVMYPEEIEAIRHRSMSPNSPAWKSDYDAMAHKTCIRQLFTLLPKSVELTAALARDGAVRTDLSEDGLTAEAPRPDGSEAADEVSDDPGENAPPEPPDPADGA